MMSESDDQDLDLSTMLNNMERQLIEKALSEKQKKKEPPHEPMVVLEISGKEPELWEERQPRFFQRLGNSIKDIFKSDIPTNATANKEIMDTADDLVRSAQEAIKSPQLINQERQASIKKQLAEAKANEAVARKTELEADLLEAEIERDKVHQSQKMIQILIQRGILVPLKQDDGEIVLLYKGKAK